MTEDNTEHLGSSDCSSGMNTAAWLRIGAAMLADDGKPNPTMMEAANEIERMRSALEKIMFWAEQDCIRVEPRRIAMEDIARECHEGLEQ